MKTSSSKAKGRRLQQWVCKKLAHLFQIEYDQQDDLCPIHSRDMGQSGVDIIIRDRQLKEKFPYAIECKNTETLSLYKNIQQAKQNTKENEQWMIVHKKNHSDPIVILDAAHFFELYKKVI